MIQPQTRDSRTRARDLLLAARHERLRVAAGVGVGLRAAPSRARPLGAAHPARVILDALRGRLAWQVCRIRIASWRAGVRATSTGAVLNRPAAFTPRCAWVFASSITTNAP